MHWYERIDDRVVTYYVSEDWVRARDLRPLHGDNISDSSSITDFKWLHSLNTLIFGVIDADMLLIDKCNEFVEKLRLSNESVSIFINFYLQSLLVAVDNASERYRMLHLPVVKLD